MLILESSSSETEIDLFEYEMNIKNKMFGFVIKLLHVLTTSKILEVVAPILEIPNTINKSYQYTIFLLYTVCNQLPNVSQ